MRTCLFLLACLFSAGCSRHADSAKHDNFFRDWLTKHGEKEVVVDGDGVGIAASPTRLKTSVYETNKHDSGYSVEMEFKISLPGGGEIVDYVAGMGETEEQATADAMANFTLSTFHVVYKAFMNSADPHQRVREVTIAGQRREMISGDLFLRGSEGSQPIDLEPLRPQIQAAVVALPLSTGRHWIKIVYGQNAGEPITVAATLDNQDEHALTDAIGKLPWPKSDGFYMAKQFIVIK
jgi:uncharacterized protein DUF6348